MVNIGECFKSNYMIRQLDRRDEPFLWELLYHALHVPEGLSPFPKEIVREPEIAKYVDRWGKDGDRGYIAVEKLTLQSVGAAWIRLFTKDCKGYGLSAMMFQSFQSLFCRHTESKGSALNYSIVRSRMREGNILRYH